MRKLQCGGEYGVIVPSYLGQDWHVHTFRSKCAKPDHTVSAIAEKADRSGLRLVGLADHVDAREQRDWFEGAIESNRGDLASLQPKARFLVGAEATMLSPSLCALESDLAQTLDFAIVACNHYHLDSVEKPRAATPQDYADHYLDMVLGAAELGFVTTISHPFLHGKLAPQLGESKVLECYDEARLSSVLRAAAKAGMAFEINPDQVRHATEWFRDLLQEARRYGTKFTLGSDAHTLAEFGYAEPAVGIGPRRVCERIGLREGDLLWPE